MAAWVAPNSIGPSGRAKAWVDYQNDVKVSDIELAAQEGYTSAEHAKRYTTLGMATDQGKLSNVNGVGLLSRTLGLGECEAGTTTFRPPYTPIAFGAVAGDAKGELFKPVRKTPMDEWHAGNGAVWERFRTGGGPTAIWHPTMRTSPPLSGGNPLPSENPWEFWMQPRWARSWSGAGMPASSSTCSIRT